MENRTNRYIGSVELNDTGRLIIESLKRAFPGRFRFRGRGPRAIHAVSREYKKRFGQDLPLRYAERIAIYTRV
jgi:hypothetical protein